MREFNILMVEDDTVIGELLKVILEKEGYNVLWRENGKQVLEDISKMDLVIMDVMIPGEDGYQITKKIKNLGLNIPVIFLSALNDMESKLHGLLIGEDYVTKPYDPRELLLRINKQLENTYGTFLKIKHLQIEANTKRLFNTGLQHEVLLTAIERKIFFYLYENRDRIVTKEHFINYLWPLEDRNRNLINVHIKKIVSSPFSVICTQS
ncbi:response regulator transcription factor [Bacillus spongiae]|uniref:Response regulator transcription factor n=1 Tax=Bacillus spongiae TaxID=2683610 RepID=A0ABU8HJ27_9BACI